jgi:hypothetical protein
MYSKVGDQHMGDRFYQQQLKAFGTAPGVLSTRRRKRVAWDDDKKAQAIEMYEAAEPTPETSVEIVKSIADELGETANGTRMILQKAGVYVKKAAPAGGGSSSAPKSGGTRVSKEAAQESLRAALSDLGQEVDEDIVGKLTGKAAMYFAGVLTAVNAAD